jgi:hypothetical protein
MLSLAFLAFDGAVSNMERSTPRNSGQHHGSSRQQHIGNGTELGADRPGRVLALKDYRWLVSLNQRTWTWENYAEDYAVLML